MFSATMVANVLFIKEAAEIGYSLILFTESKNVIVYIYLKINISVNNDFANFYIRLIELHF